MPRLPRSAVHVAVLFRAVDPHAVERVGCDVAHKTSSRPVKAQLRAVPTFRCMQPHQDLELELQLVGVLGTVRQ